MFWKIYSIVGMQSRQWVSTVFNDAENWNWGNQIESKQPFHFYGICEHHGSLIPRCSKNGWGTPLLFTSAWEWG